VAAGIATLGIILAAIYMLVLYQRTMTGPVAPEVAGTTFEGSADLSMREKLVIAPVLAVIVFFGFYPRPLLDAIKPAVQATLQQTGNTDPAPVVPVAATANNGGNS